MPNLAPTPSATPITGIYCKTFPAVSFEANRFADLSLEVDELLSRIRGVDNEIEYHVKFGDGTKIYNKHLPYNDNAGYKAKVSHTYEESDIYLAQVAVDNISTLRRSCASVNVFIARSAPLKCSELHIQSNTSDGDSEFIDLSQSEYEIDSVSAIHSSDNPIFGSSSVHLEEENDNYSLNLIDSKTGFNFFHENPKRNWTVQPWQISMK